jgi:hypothetical protein
VLNDKSEYVIKKNVPVLDEHKLFDDDGKILAVIDESRLQQIADNNNRKIKETGDEVPLIVGHTNDDDPETKQPPIVGYATDFQVKRLFKTGRKALFATFKFFKDTAHLARQFPRRSVELWLRKWEVDPISLLGAHTPERSLGLLRFNRADGLHYSRAYSDMPLPQIRRYNAGQNPDMLNQVLAAIQQTDLWQEMKALVEQIKAGQGMPSQSGPGMGDQGGAEPVYEEPEPGMEPEQPAEDEHEQYEAEAARYDADAEAEQYDMDAIGYEAEARLMNPGQNEHYEAAASPSGSDTFIPSGNTHAKRLIKQAQTRNEQYGGYSKSAKRQSFVAPGEQYCNILGEPEEADYNVSQAEEYYDPEYRRTGSTRVQAKPSPVTDNSQPKAQMSRLTNNQARVQTARRDRDVVMLQRQVERLQLENRTARIERDLTQLAAEGVLFDPQDEFNELVKLSADQYGRYIQRMRDRYQRDPAGQDIEVLQYARQDRPSQHQTYDGAMAAAEQALKTGKSYDEVRGEIARRPSV